MIEVLRTAGEAATARAWLRGRGWDVQRRPLTRVVYALRTRHRMHFEFLKSWDVAHFARILTTELRPEAAVVDVGSVGSELPWVLRLAGFQNITGCDLDDQVLKMPFARTITYRLGEIQQLGLAEASVDAVTAVSTIEHGVDVAQFLRSSARLLRSGGLLCLSTDYWPSKVDTADVRYFGAPWTIFAEDEIRGLIQAAAAAGLTLDSWSGTLPTVIDRPVSWHGRSYTFIALVLRKR
jgi:SAM-dependent methyltransferase